MKLRLIPGCYLPAGWKSEEMDRDWTEGEVKELGGRGWFPLGAHLISLGLCGGGLEAVA